MFLTLNNKAKTDLNANFGLFTIDGNKKVYHGLGHHICLHWGAGLVKVVSINF